eukprot:9840602-Heterocapsa_arctica.AAC.2
MNKGYTFVWLAYSNPYFVTPNGFKVELEVIANIPYLRRGSARSVPFEVPNHGFPLTPRRSRPALPAPDLGGGLGDEMDLIPDGGGAGDGDEPPPPPPPVPDGEQVEQAVRRRRVKKDDALSLEHMLNHKPSNPICDACMRGKMRDCRKFKGAFAASRKPN